MIRGDGNWTSGGGSLVNFGGRLNDFLGGFKLLIIRSSAERVWTGDGWLPSPAAGEAIKATQGFWGWGGGDMWRGFFFLLFQMIELI